MPAKKNKPPKFKSSPIIEASLSVQFVPIDGLTIAHLGLWWNRFRDQFPEVEQHEPIPSAIEIFGQLIPLNQSITTQLVNRPTLPRCWFKNSSSTEIIQIQADRLVHNWRKVNETDEYPGYDRVKEQFFTELVAFEEFLKSEKLGKLIPVQCEVYYSNHIVAGRAWQKPANLDQILTMWRGQYNDKFLNEPEMIRLSQVHVIPDKFGDPVGRLYIEGHTGFKTPDKQPVFVLNFMARAKPDGESFEQVANCFDLGRLWVERTFLSITTEQMQALWGSPE